MCKKWRVSVRGHGFHFFVWVCLCVYECDVSIFHCKLIILPKKKEKKKIALWMVARNQTILSTNKTNCLTTNVFHIEFSLAFQNINLSSGQLQWRLWFLIYDASLKLEHSDNQWAEATNTSCVWCAVYLDQILNPVWFTFKSLWDKQPTSLVQISLKDLLQINDIFRATFVKAVALILLT